MAIATVAYAEPPAIVRREQDRVQGREGQAIEKFLRQIYKETRLSQQWKELLASTEPAERRMVEAANQMDFERHRMLAKLAELSALPDNWDGYGSPGPQPAVQEAASALIGILWKAGVPTPHFAPVSGGGLQLEWQKQGRELELEILPHGEIAFLKVYESGEMQEGILPCSAQHEVVELVRWFNA